MTAPALETSRSVLVDRVAQIAARNGAAVAVEGPRTTLTYSDVRELASSWAALLSAPEGSVVALRVVDPTHLAAAFLAVRAAHLVPMLVDPQAPAARRAAVLGAARPALLMDVQEVPVVTPGDTRPRQLRPDAGYLGFTSGTQGPPKGIVAHERGVLHFVDWEAGALGIRPSDRIAMISPPTFEVIFREMFAALSTGARVVAGDALTRTDPHAVVPWLAEREIDIVHAVPALAARWAGATPSARLPDLRWTMFAGEPLHGCHIDAWRAVAPDTLIGNLYGPSETTLAKFFYRVPADHRPGLQPVGQPLPDTQLMRLEPAGDVFRVGIRTPHGSFGYLEGTATSADRAALMRTGDSTTFHSRDLAALDQDGNLVVKGRLDSRVKRRGVFVDLTAIEEAANRIPGITAAGCLQNGPEAGGEIVLYAETSAAASRPLHRELLRTLGPEAPDRVVALERLPLSPNGKIDRRALTALTVKENA